MTSGAQVTLSPMASFRVSLNANAAAAWRAGQSATRPAAVSGTRSSGGMLCTEGE